MPNAYVTCNYLMTFSSQIFIIMFSRNRVTAEPVSQNTLWVKRCARRQKVPFQGLDDVYMHFLVHNPRNPQNFSPLGKFNLKENVE